MQWGKLNGRALTVVEKCLRSRRETERFTFADYQQEIDAGRAVLVTLSFDAGSEEGLSAAAAAQQRVSVVGVGYEVQGSETRNELRYYEPSLIPHPSSPFLIVQLPADLWERPRAGEAPAVEQLKRLLTDYEPPANSTNPKPISSLPRPLWKRLPWEVSEANVVFTLAHESSEGNAR